MRTSFAFLLLMMIAPRSLAWEPKSKSVARGEQTLELDSGKLTESSGLVFSRVNDTCIWSHNDSGGKARLYAFDEKGESCGRLTLEDASAVDWEDIAGYTDEVPRLLIADVGDNQARRDTVSLYLIDEPDPTEKTESAAYQHLKVRYEDGSRNCESVAVEMSNRRILLVSKSPLGASLHEVPLPPRSTDDGPVHLDVVAKRIGSLPLPMATGMDLDPSSGDLWVTSYFQAFCFRGPEPIEDRIKTTPEGFKLPRLKQIEAIAVDGNGRVWVTSEGKPTKMRRVMTVDSQ